MVILNKSISVPFRFVGYQENCIFFENRGKDKQIIDLKIYMPKPKDTLIETPEVHEKSISSYLFLVKDPINILSPP